MVRQLNVKSYRKVSDFPQNCYRSDTSLVQNRIFRFTNIFQYKPTLCLILFICVAGGFLSDIPHSKELISANTMLSRGHDSGYVNLEMQPRHWKHNNSQYCKHCKKVDSKKWQVLKRGGRSKFKQCLVGRRACQMEIYLLN